MAASGAGGAWARRRRDLSPSLRPLCKLLIIFSFFLLSFIAIKPSLLLPCYKISQIRDREWSWLPASPLPLHLLTRLLSEPVTEESLISKRWSYVKSENGLSILSRSTDPRTLAILVEQLPYRCPQTSPISPRSLKQKGSNQATKQLSVKLRLVRSGTLPEPMKKMTAEGFDLILLLTSPYGLGPRFQKQQVGPTRTLSKPINYVGPMVSTNRPICQVIGLVTSLHGLGPINSPTKPNCQVIGPTSISTQLICQVVGPIHILLWQRPRYTLFNVLSRSLLKIWCLIKDGRRRHSILVATSSDQTCSFQNRRDRIDGMSSDANLKLKHIGLVLFSNHSWCDAFQASVMFCEHISSKAQVDSKKILAQPHQSATANPSRLIKVPSEAEALCIFEDRISLQDQKNNKIIIDSDAKNVKTAMGARQPPITPRIIIESDTKAVITAINSRKTPANLTGIVNDISHIANSFRSLSFNFIPRSHNCYGDDLVKKALRSMTTGLSMFL